MVELTFGPSAAETVLDQFGYEVNDEGVIVYQEDGEPAKTYSGHTITIDELGGIVKNEDGYAVPIRDNFVDIADYVKSVN